MKLGIDRNFDSVPDSDQFEPVPPGWYNAAITDAEVKQTKKGDGRYLLLKHQIIGPTRQGRVIHQYLNFDNPSQTATLIGLRELKGLLKAVGIEPNQFDESDELIGKHLKIKVVIRPETLLYGAGNTIKKVASIEKDKSIDNAIKPSLDEDGDIPF